MLLLLLVVVGKTAPLSAMSRRTPSTISNKHSSSGMSAEGDATADSPFAEDAAAAVDDDEVKEEVHCCCCFRFSASRNDPLEVVVLWSLAVLPPPCEPDSETRGGGGDRAREWLVTACSGGVLAA